MTKEPFVSQEEETPEKTEEETPEGDKETGGDEETE